MSLFSRRFLLLLPAAVALAACGFTPVYGPDGTATELRGRVLIDEPVDTDSYLLVRDLEQILGQTKGPIYRLSYKLLTETQGQAITAEGDITRYSIFGEVAYTLRKADTDAIVASGEVDNFTGYSATGTTVETLASERDAYARLMTILADQIAIRLYSSVKIPE
ncbi:MAG: LPS-assembly lipoprotein [Paracoccaceae bacterium]|jgi:LPS-assembly lipoprotein